MSSLFILIPVSMVLLIAAIGAFVWAVNRDQFEDLERQGSSALDLDESRESSESSERDR